MGRTMDLFSRWVPISSLMPWEEMECGLTTHQLSQNWTSKGATSKTSS